MNVGTFLQHATKQLSDAGIETARLDCLVLLEDELAIDRARLLAHPEYEIDDSHLLNLNKKVMQRVVHTPLAYVRGHADFYGRTFAVNKRVLVPRPETEALVDLLKTLSLPKAPRIADIGTGSGCIGITAALEVSNSTVHLYDIDPDALAIANANARTHKIRAQYYSVDLLSQNWGPYNVILANLPYVPDTFEVNEAATHEPKLALFAGTDGMDLYRKFWQQISGLHEKPRYVLTESFPFQHRANTTLAKDAGYTLQKTDDFAQCFKLES